MSDTLLCTHKGLLLGVVPVYTEDDDQPGMIIRHWSLALPAGVAYGFWRLWTLVADGYDEGIPVLITGELEEPIEFEVD